MWQPMGGVRAGMLGCGCPRQAQGWVCWGHLRGAHRLILTWQRQPTLWQLSQTWQWDVRGLRAEDETEAAAASALFFFFLDTPAGSAAAAGAAPGCPPVAVAVPLPLAAAGPGAGDEGTGGGASEGGGAVRDAGASAAELPGSEPGARDAAWPAI